MTTGSLAGFSAQPVASPVHSGNTAWTEVLSVELRDVVRRASAGAARSVQKHLGPSEIGHPCDRQVAGKLAGLPDTNHVSDPWPSVVGTAVHAWLADAFTADNPRWLAEARVTPHPEHPGTADLLDLQDGTLIDHKVLGSTTHAKIRKEGPSRTYRVQVLLYAHGWRLLGIPVRRVAIAAWPRTTSYLNDLYVWGEDLTPETDALVEHVLNVELPRRQAYAQSLLAGAPLSSVPASPSASDCFFCPFYRPEVARDPSAPGCAGHTASTLH